MKNTKKLRILMKKKTLEAMQRINGRRKSTSVALEDKTIKELTSQQIAKKRNISYQALMRMFILDGMERIKKAG